MMPLDVILTCPFDESHRIRKSVLQYHLVRCKKNHPSLKVQCPFDALHLIDGEYFQHHISNCASSCNVRRELYSFESTCELGSVPLKTVKNLSVPLMDDWHEENVKMYDPWKSTETRNIIRCLIGGTKSEKKLFKLAERKRIENLEKTGITKSNRTNNFNHTKLRKHVNISQLIKNLKKLTLVDFDTLLKSIDISKLFISDVDNIAAETMQVSEIVEEILIQKFKKLMLSCLKKEIS